MYCELCSTLCSAVLSICSCLLCDWVGVVIWLLVVLFFKQKTAYEMRISDWSSDVCSSDLLARLHRREQTLEGDVDELHLLPESLADFVHEVDQIGRASCRERVCQYV